MTEQEALASPQLRMAAHKAHRAFMAVPGCWQEPEDFLQAGRIAVVEAFAAKGPDIPPALLFTIVRRRMVDYGRLHMGVTREERRAAARGEGDGFAVLSLDHRPLGEDWPSIGESLQDGAARDPLVEAERARLRELLRRNDAGLTEREARVLSLYYFEELTFREIGEQLGVVQSRASQMHAEAIGKLRRHMDIAPTPATPTTLPPETRCAPCENAGRFRFHDAVVDGVPMCKWCAREAKDPPVAKLKRCACGAQFQPRGRRTYCEKCRPPVKTHVAHVAAAPSHAPAITGLAAPIRAHGSMVTVTVPVSLLDTMWQALSPEQKARAIEQAVRGV